MKLITTDEMKKLDHRVVVEGGIVAETLMVAAGLAVADSIRRLAKQHQLVDVPVLFVAGCGNNGGDAFVAATALYEEGWPVEVWLAGTEQRIKDPARIPLKRMRKAGVPFEEIDQGNIWQRMATCGTDAEIVIDALLGTGFSGEPRGAVADALAFVNQCADQALVLAVDMPSAWSIRADVTVTMGLPKVDLVQPEYIDLVGALEVADIGFPEEIVSEAKAVDGVELLHASDLSSCFRRRARDSHKGDFGHVLCIGGSKGYSGAVVLAARSALRSGAGLVSALVSEEIYDPVATAVPEAMVHTDFPALCTQDWDAILIGPGAGRTDALRDRVLELLKHSRVPVVIDADALTVLNGQQGAIRAANCPVILTPHPGEFASLLGLKTADVQEDRFGLAQMAAANLNVTLALKGAGTVVAAPEHPLAVNMNGNPGMACGGSGDVLAGLVAGLLAQGLSPFEATCAAVWMHGRAGDCAAAEKSQASIMASDLIAALPEVSRELSCR